MLRKKKSKKEFSRSIPQADLSDFEAPDLSGVKPLTNSDNNAIKGLIGEFLETGVVTRVANYSDSRQTLNDVSQIFKEATDVAKYERELNPTKYSEELEDYLIDKNNLEGDNDITPFTTEEYFKDESEKRFI